MSAYVECASVCMGTSTRIYVSMRSYVHVSLFCRLNPLWKEKLYEDQELNMNVDGGYRVDGVISAVTAHSNAGYIADETDNALVAASSKYSVYVPGGGGYGSIIFWSEIKLSR